MFYILNYDILNYGIWYTLLNDVKFSINFDENSKFKIQNIIKSIVYGVKV